MKILITTSYYYMMEELLIELSWIGQNLQFILNFYFLNNS